MGANLTMGELHLVSIIIPTYNREKLLPRAIDSVKEQTYKKWELLLVDDGSTDNTKGLVENYIKKDRRIKYLVNTRKKGPAGARNTGILAAKGDYIAFLDSDDEWMPEKLKIYLNYFEKNPEIDTFCSNDVMIKPEEEIERSNVYDPPAMSKEKIFEYVIKKGDFFAQTSSMMVKRKVFNSVGLFDENLMRCEDIDLYLRINEKFKWSYIKKPLSRQCWLPERMANYQEERKMMGNQQLHSYYLMLMLKNLHHKIRLDKNQKSLVKIKLKETKKKVSEYFFNQGYFGFRKTNKKKALKYYLKSLYYHFGLIQLKAIIKLFIPFYYSKLNS